jgi:glycosyltransferase involved in cell wall biosynthesis
MNSLVMLEGSAGRAEVLVVTSIWPTPERPHLGIFVKRQVDSLRDLGIHSDVLVIRGDRSPLAYLDAARRLAGFGTISGRRYRLVHAHGGESALAARFYWRAPLLVSYLGSDVLGVPGGGGVSAGWRLRRILIRQWARFASATITKSRAMEAALPRRTQRRNRVIPNGVDRSLFRPLDRDRARAELGWNPEERVVLFAADPDLPYKRHDLAVAACERAARRLADLRLEVANGVPPHRVPLLMSASDCLLHPSAGEGSPNVVKEALCCNLPVVATPVGDVPERLAGVGACRVCPPDAGALADALVRCLETPIRSNGYECTEDLDQDRVAARLATLYRDLAGPEIGSR